MFRQRLGFGYFLGKFIWLTLLAFFLLYAPFFLDLNPKSYSLQLPSDFAGTSARNQLLNQIEKLYENEVHSPSSPTKYKGSIYAGTSKGNIIRFNSSGSRFESLIYLIDDCNEKVENGLDLTKCGYPINLRFDGQGTLWILDAFYGLWQIDRIHENSKESLTKINVVHPRDTDVECRQSTLFYDLVLNDRFVYLSDVSGKWNWNSYLYSTLEPSVDGRILKYDLETKSLSVVLNKLWNPTGLEITDDREALLICESSKQRIIKFYLKGPKAGSVDIFADLLPGEPESIRRSGNQAEETYWVGFSTGRTAQSPIYGDYLTEYPTVRLFLVRVIYGIGAGLKMVGDLSKYNKLSEYGFSFMNGDNPVFKFLYSKQPTIVEIDYQGLIMSTLQISTEGGRVGRIGAITEEVSSTERERILYIGLLENKFLGKLRVDTR